MGQWDLLAGEVFWDSGIAQWVEHYGKVGITQRLANCGISKQPSG